MSAIIEATVIEADSFGHLVRIDADPNRQGGAATAEADARPVRRAGAASASPALRCIGWHDARVRADLEWVGQGGG